MSKAKKSKTLVLPFTLPEFNEFMSMSALSKMRDAHEAGHAIAALDALVFCTERNLPVPDWASHAILEKDYVVRGQRGQKPAHLQYLQYVKEAFRYMTVRLCEEEKRTQKKRGHDKFEDAFESLEGKWPATKESSGLRKSFYKFKDRWSGKFYLSYIFYRRDRWLATLYCTINRRKRIPFDNWAVVKNPQR